MSEKNTIQTGEFVEMIAETMATEFPEFLMAVAEENWIRGYHQALDDVDAGQTMEDEALLKRLLIMTTL